MFSHTYRIAVKDTGVTAVYLKSTATITVAKSEKWYVRAPRVKASISLTTTYTECRDRFLV